MTITEIEVAADRVRRTRGQVTALKHAISEIERGKFDPENCYAFIPIQHIFSVCNMNDESVTIDRNALIEILRAALSQYESDIRKVQPIIDAANKSIREARS